MIPKIIHLCWLSGDPYPEKIAYCIDSMKKYLPDYEIMIWDTKRFDLESSIWCKEAFENKKYAFAADYIRCYSLYHYGGIYLDSDVEVLKSFNDLLDLPYFIGKEQKAHLEPAIMGAEKGWVIMKDMLDYYKDRHFIKSDGTYDMKTMPDIMDELLSHKLNYKVINSKNEFDDKNGILSVFTAEYFSPKYSNNPNIRTTKNTYTIHHFEATWYPVGKKMFRVITKYFGYKTARFFSILYKKVFNV